MSAPSETTGFKLGESARQTSYPRLLRVACPAVFAGALTAGTALRLWQLASKPDWQYDEGVYTRVAENVMHGTLNEHLTVGVPWQPFLYQPPFYCVGLAKWFALTGPGVAPARLLGVLLSMATLAMLFALLWRIHGPAAALFASIPVVFDGWLMYVQRISYIENALLLIIVAGLLAYQTALARNSWRWFLMAGMVLGFAAVFKQSGVYILPAVAFCWLILRRQHKCHLLLLGTAAVVFVTYVGVMARLYDIAGHDWYLQESMVQVRRVLGLQRSGGTLTSPVHFLNLITAQYRVFLPSLLVAAAAFGVAVRRLGQCYRARNWRPAQGNALLFAWLAAGIVVFGASSLRFPQYFELLLVPLYCFLWTEIYRWQWWRSGKTALIALAAVAGLGSFYLRVLTYDHNVFAEVQRYAATAVPRHSTILTEEAIGDLIQQPWCRVEYAEHCAHSATYAITWRTYLQSSFKLGDPAFLHLMRGAVPITSFTGFNGTATVWRLR